MELRHQALAVLCITDPAEKAAAARSLGEMALPIDTQTQLVASGPLPGRPPRPQLVPATQVPRRSPFTTEGRAALLHSVAHIEFNAIKIVLPISILSRENNDNCTNNQYNR